MNNMGDRFYTEGNAMVDDDDLAEMQYQMMLEGNDEDNEELLESSSNHAEFEDYQDSHNHRMHTHENRHRELLDVK